MQLIGGSWYGDEMKKGVFSVMNYRLPRRGMATMTVPPTSAQTATPPSFSACFGADSRILDPRSTYADVAPGEWETKAKQLAAPFSENFREYEDSEEGRQLAGAKGLVAGERPLRRPRSLRGTNHMRRWPGGEFPVTVIHCGLGRALKMRDCPRAAPPTPR